MAVLSFHAAGWQRLEGAVFRQHRMGTGGLAGPLSRHWTVTNNACFLILPGVRVPHLASHALGLAVPGGRPVRPAPSGCARWSPAGGSGFAAARTGRSCGERPRRSPRTPGGRTWSSASPATPTDQWHSDNDFGRSDKETPALRAFCRKPGAFWRSGSVRRRVVSATCSLAAWIPSCGFAPAFRAGCIARGRS